MKTISIVIPIYNTQIFLKQCLQSIINQTYKSLEIILINDGSTDSSKDICEDFQKLDSRIILVNQLNQGLSAARNAGITIAKGDFILFVDSDDWIDENLCEDAINSFINHNCDIVFFSYVKEYINKSTPNHLFEKDNLYNYSDSKKLHQRIIGLSESELSNPANTDSLVTAWGKLYKTNLIKSNKLSFTDCKIIGTEDMLFNVNYFHFVKSASYINKCYYHYRKFNNESLTSTYKVNLQRQWNNLFDRVQAFIDKNELPEEYQTAFNNRIALSIIGIGLNEIGSSDSILIKIKKIKQYISAERYKNAIKNLNFSYFPIHWNIFFSLSKRRKPMLLFGMLFIIGKILKFNNR